MSKMRLVILIAVVSMAVAAAVGFHRGLLGDEKARSDAIKDRLREQSGEMQRQIDGLPDLQLWGN